MCPYSPDFHEDHMERGRSGGTPGGLPHGRTWLDSTAERPRAQHRLSRCPRRFARSSVHRGGCSAGSEEELSREDTVRRGLHTLCSRDLTRQVPARTLHVHSPTRTVSSVYTASFATVGFNLRTGFTIQWEDRPFTRETAGARPRAACGREQRPGSARAPSGSQEEGC